MSTVEAGLGITKAGSAEITESGLGERLRGADPAAHVLRGGTISQAKHVIPVAGAAVAVQM